MIHLKVSGGSEPVAPGQDEKRACLICGGTNDRPDYPLCCSVCFGAYYCPTCRESWGGCKCQEVEYDENDEPIDPETERGFGVGLKAEEVA